MDKKRVKFFTSECVTEGHPDMVAGCISDAFLDECLAQDPKSRVAVETLVTTGQVVVAGEVTTEAYVDTPKIVRDTIRRIGYVGTEGFDADNCGILSAIHQQSPDIAMGVDVGGAGDQGMMFGGAVKETPELMPLPIAIARALTNKLTELRVKYSFLRPDGKSQVTVRYEDDKPVGIDAVVVSVSHTPDYTVEIPRFVTDKVIAPVLKEYGYSLKDVRKVYINPTGAFTIYGPNGDTGLTGRKIIVDTYGGYFSHGGGCFPGKDPTKVDRSAAFAARYIAKNIVASGVARKCEVQLSYAIGVAEPTSIYINTFGTLLPNYTEQDLEEVCKEIFPCTPEWIIETFKLREPNFKYQDLTARGTFGRTDIALPWEKADKYGDILKALEARK